MAEILTPACPVCGEPPAIMLPGATQAFCGCDLWCWNPSVSLDDNLMDAGVAKFDPPLEGT